MTKQGEQESTEAPDAAVGARTSSDGASTGTWQRDTVPPATPEHPQVAIQAKVLEIEGLLVKANKLVDEIGGGSVTARKAAEAIGKQLEAADALLKHAQVACETSDAADKRTAELESHAATALASLEKHEDAATTSAARIEELKAEAEQSKAQWLASLETVRGLAKTAAESGSQIEAIKTGAEQTQAVIAKKSSHIEDGRVHVDKVRAEIDTVLNDAKRSATDAESQHQSSRTAADNVESVLADMQASKNNAESICGAMAQTQNLAEGYAASTKRLADVALNTEQRIIDYEAQLKAFAEQAESQQSLIDALLRGATNAGLASAYAERSKSFMRPARFWQGTFITSLVVLLGLAFFEVIYVGGGMRSADWQELLRTLLHRLPFAVPLIWLAIHAARQASMAKRMEEEYAFKATSSMSFEGYRRQMAEAGRDAVGNEALSRFLNDNISNISSPPGKVYDKQRMDPTPGTVAAEMLPAAKAAIRAGDGA